MPNQPPIVGSEGVNMEKLNRAVGEWCRAEIRLKALRTLPRCELTEPYDTETGSGRGKCDKEDEDPCDACRVRWEFDLEWKQLKAARAGARVRMLKYFAKGE